MMITSEEIRQAVLEPADKVIHAIRETLTQTPPELSADLVNNGLVLAGGGAMLRGMKELIEEGTGLPVHVAEEPLTAVARGTGMYLEDLDRWSKWLSHKLDVA